jgi:tRNA-Thr(GGU) m(6)t(6)A37 methyltransferase TsaA
MKKEETGATASYRVRRIGTIRTPYKEKAPRQPVEKAEGEFHLVIDPQYVSGLRGLESFRYVYVIYYMHRIQDDVSMMVKSSRAGGKEVGLFASRSPKRPSPIGLSIVQVLKIVDNEILTSGLDAFDGTPLLDIKPYVRNLDCKGAATKKR